MGETDVRCLVPSTPSHSQQWGLRVRGWPSCCVRAPGHNTGRPVLSGPGAPHSPGVRPSPGHPHTRCPGDLAQATHACSGLDSLPTLPGGAGSSAGLLLRSPRSLRGHPGPIFETSDLRPSLVSNSTLFLSADLEARAPGGGGEPTLCVPQRTVSLRASQRFDVAAQIFCNRVSYPGWDWT